MNRSKSIFLVLALAMMGGTVWACLQIKQHQRLGEPGLKLVPVPSLNLKGKEVRTQSVYFPETVAGFTSRNLPIMDDELSFLPADTLFGRKAYETTDKFGLTMSAVMMGTDSRSIHKPQICLPAQGWNILSQNVVMVPVTGEHAYSVPIMKVIAGKKIKTAKGEEDVRTVFLYWFVTDREMTADHFDRMWRMGVNMLRTGVMQRWSYVICAGYCYPGQEEATYTRMEGFLKETIPQFQTTVVAAADGK